jgi:hypothetical protein
MYTTTACTHLVRFDMCIWRSPISGLQVAGGDKEFLPAFPLGSPDAVTAVATTADCQNDEQSRIHLQQSKVTLAVRKSNTNPVSARGPRGFTSVSPTAAQYE